MASEALSPMHPALAMLQRETRVRAGAVAAELDGVPVPRGAHLIRREAFLLNGEEGIRLLYRRGEGITVDAPPQTDPRDVSLWLNGTIYAAVAAINGLMPLHASAVAWGGRVYAFTGPSGGGKSTLSAALGREGLPLFCDDTLILDLSGTGEIVCLPGHKRLKLWPHGIALAGAAAREPVASDLAKLFADPPGGVVSHPLPLAELIFLEHGEEPALLAVPPGERIARLQDDHYTAELFERAGMLNRRQRFAQLAGIAARMPMRRFARPLVAARFAEAVGFIADHIRSGASA